jgi:hypothetical protein
VQIPLRYHQVQRLPENDADVNAAVLQEDHVRLRAPLGESQEIPEAWIEANVCRWPNGKDETFDCLLCQTPGRATLPRTSRLRFLYLSYLSKPVADRLVYRLIPRRRVLKIVEFGVRSGQRAIRMIQAAAYFTTPEQVQYTGIDLFEARGDPTRPGLALKEAHRLLKATDARIRLLPGDPFSALARAANSSAETDLVIISADQDPVSLARAWFYLPRMLHSGSQVYQEEVRGPNQDVALRLVPAGEISALAATRCRYAA